MDNTINFNCRLGAEKIKDRISEEIFKLKGRRPSLAIILIGERADSRLYVEIKEREAKKVGIDTHIYRCDSDIPEPEIFAMIDFLNRDEEVDAILLQLPLPSGFDTDGIIMAIDPKKDVDRFHPDNLEKLFKTCAHDDVIPPVFKSVLHIMKEIAYELKGKRVGVLANSDIFGKGLARILSCRGAEVELIKINDKSFAQKTLECDCLISAIGKAQFIKNEMVKKGALLIDIGISREQGKVYGDFDFDDIGDKALYITPVPGGIGPLTVAMLFENVLELS